MTTNLKRKIKDCNITSGKVRNIPLSGRDLPADTVDKRLTPRRKARDGQDEGRHGLYDGGRAPNPRRVRIFLAEKGISVPLQPVNIGAMEQRSPDYARINPMQRVPALVLDNGTVIAESVAICRYFEATQPDPALFGTGAEEMALVEMWKGGSNSICFNRSRFYLSSRPSGDEGDGAAAGRAVGGGQPAARHGFPEIPRWRTRGPAIHRRQHFFHRRHHRALRRRFHAAGAARRAGGIRTRPSLAR